MKFLDSDYLRLKALVQTHEEMNPANIHMSNIRNGVFLSGALMSYTGEKPDLY